MTEGFINLDKLEQDAQQEETPSITLWAENMSLKDRLILIWHTLWQKPYTFENPIRELSGVQEGGEQTDET